MAACGTVAGYNGGCRCTRCRDAIAGYRRARRAGKGTTPRRLQAGRTGAAGAVARADRMPVPPLRRATTPAAPAPRQESPTPAARMPERTSAGPAPAPSRMPRLGPGLALTAPMPTRWDRARPPAGGAGPVPARRPWAGLPRIVAAYRH